MGRLAVIGKHATLGEPRGVPIDGTSADIVDGGEHLVLYRHGIDDDVAPHRIDHAAHLRALVDLDCDRVVAVSSVGGVRLDLPVGTFIAPDDFIALDQSPVVAVDTKAQHVVPGFTPSWRASVSAYAAVCVVDNLANGLGAVLLTPEEYALGQEQNRDRLLGVLANVVPELAR